MGKEVFYQCDECRRYFPYELKVVNVREWVNLYADSPHASTRGYWRDRGFVVCDKELAKMKSRD